MHDWPLSKILSPRWHALQRTLASDLASQLLSKETVTPRSADTEVLTSWLVRALVDHPPTSRLAQ